MKETLRKYLTEEFMECMDEEKNLLEQKYLLEAEQEKYRESMGFLIEDEKRRQLFSPIMLQGYAGQERKLQASKAGKELENCKKKISDISMKKAMLKELMNQRNVSKKEEKQEETKDENVSMFPALYELIEHTKLSFKDVDFLYDSEETTKQEYPMTMGFLTGWKNFFQYIKTSLALEDIFFQVFEEDGCRITMECAVKGTFSEEQKEALELHLTNRFSICNWDEESFTIEVIVK